MGTGCLGGVLLFNSVSGCLVYHKAFSPWFLLPPPVTDAGHTAPDVEDNATLDTVCSGCGLPHAEPSKLASLFFALQTFSADLGLPAVPGAPSRRTEPSGTSSHHATGTATPCPVHCIAFEGVAVRFAQHEDDDVPITGALLTSKALDATCAEYLVRSIVGEFVKAHPARLGHTVKATRYRSFGGTLRGLLRSAALQYTSLVCRKVVGSNTSTPWWLTVLCREDHVGSLTPWRQSSRTVPVPSSSSGAAPVTVPTSHAAPVTVPTSHGGKPGASDGKVAHVTLPALVTPHAGTHSGSSSVVAVASTPGSEISTVLAPKPRWWQRRTVEPSPRAGELTTAGPTLVPTRPATSGDATGASRGVSGRIKRMFRTSAPAAATAGGSLGPTVTPTPGYTSPGCAGRTLSQSDSGALPLQQWWLTTLTAAHPASATAPPATEVGATLPWLRDHLWGTGGDAAAGVMYQTHCVDGAVVGRSGLGLLVEAGSGTQPPHKSHTHSSALLAQDHGVHIVVTVPNQVGVDVSMPSTASDNLKTLVHTLQLLLPYADLT